MNGTEKQIAFANDIIKEWRNHAATKKAFYESKEPNEAGMKLLEKASEVLEERIAACEKASEIISSRYSKDFDYENIFITLMRGFTARLF